jgi:hypothetical protein
MSDRWSFKALQCDQQSIFVGEEKFGACASRSAYKIEYDDLYSDKRVVVSVVEGKIDSLSVDRAMGYP